MFGIGRGWSALGLNLYENAREIHLYNLEEDTRQHNAFITVVL